MPALLLFLAALAGLTLALPFRDFLMIDTRFALFVHEMGWYGIEPFPRLYGQLYPDYTSLPTLLMYGACRLGGGVNMFTAVLPSAIAGALTVTMTFLIGRRMVSGRFGLTAALLLFCSYAWLELCRVVSVDLYPTLATALIFYLLYTADETKRYGRLGWIVPLLLFGFCARGPIGVIIPTGVAAAYCLVERRWRRGILIGAAAVALLAGMLVFWAHLAYRWGGEQFYADFWRMQIGDRFESCKSIFYYFTNAVGSYAMTYPLALAVVAVSCWVWRGEFFRRAETRNLRNLQLLTAWMFIVILGMSVPGSKHLRYVGPMLPAAALLAAMVFANPDHLKLYSRVRMWFNRIWVWLPAAALLTLAVLAIVTRIPAVAERLHGGYRPPWAVLLGYSAAAAALVHRARRFGPWRRTLAGLVALAVFFLIVRIWVVEPIDQAQQSSRAFVAAVETLRAPDEALYFYGLGPDGDENKYMVLVDRDRIFTPRCIFDPQRVDHSREEELTTLAELVGALPVGARVVMRLDKWEEDLPAELRDKFTCRLSGRIGRRDCALVERIQQ